MMGGKLATIFARAGHEVVFSNARSEQKLKHLARNAGGNARAGTPGAPASALPARVAVRAVADGLPGNVRRRKGLFTQPGDVPGRRAPEEADVIPAEL